MGNLADKTKWSWIISLSWAMLLLAPACAAAQQKSVERAAIKEYKSGEAYALGDVVALNAEGNKLTVELNPSTEHTTTGTVIELKLKVTGDAQVLGFSWGRENSAIFLAVGENKVPVSKAWFTNEIVATFAKATLVTRLTVDSPKGPLTYDTTERPLVVRFQVPAELSKAAKQLELKEVMIGGPHYSLTVKLGQ